VESQANGHQTTFSNMKVYMRWNGGDSSRALRRVMNQEGRPVQTVGATNKKGRQHMLAHMCRRRSFKKHILCLVVEQIVVVEQIDEIWDHELTFTVQTMKTI